MIGNNVLNEQFCEYIKAHGYLLCAFFTEPPLRSASHYRILERVFKYDDNDDDVFFSDGQHDIQDDICRFMVANHNEIRAEIMNLYQGFYNKIPCYSVINDIFKLIINTASIRKTRSKHLISFWGIDGFLKMFEKDGRYIIDEGRDFSPDDCCVDNKLDIPGGDLSYDETATECPLFDEWLSENKDKDKDYVYLYIFQHLADIYDDRVGICFASEQDTNEYIIDSFIHHLKPVDKIKTHEPKYQLQTEIIYIHNDVKYGDYDNFIKQLVEKEGSAIINKILKTITVSKFEELIKDILTS